MKDALENIRTYYNDVYHRNHRINRVISRHHKGLLRKLAVSDKDSVLDVGCGTGEWLLACRNNGAIPYGIDLSGKAIAICREAMPAGFFFDQPAESFPFKNNYFDLITCLGSLEHFIDALASLKEMVRVAKSDARIVILVPNRDFLARKLGLFSGTDQVNAKEDVKTIEQWGQLFHDAGLEVTQKWKDLHTLSWSWISRRGIIHAPLRALYSLSLLAWPLKWQYQVYFACRLRTG